MGGWLSIDTHPRNEEECLLAILHEDGLYVADRGGYVPPEQHEEWDEVEDGVKVKLAEWEEGEGGWWSNHNVIDEPTHWAPLSPPRPVTGGA